MLARNFFLAVYILILIFLEINLKQQLVDQLEKAQKNLYTMKAQYEDKMKLLQHQIKSIESERDRVLKEISRLNVRYIVLILSNRCI